MSGEFWDDNEFASMFCNTPNSEVVTAYLGDDPERQVTMTDLTDQGRASKALPTSSPAGTRVSFVRNLGTVMAYKSPPGEGVKGTVVKVRTSSGDTTAIDEYVFVKYDDGTFMPTHHEHLRLAGESLDMRYRLGNTRTYDRVIVASLGLLGDEFFRAAGTGNDLVHKATKDLWSFSQTEGGEFVIERLFDDDGEPLKA